MKRILSSLIILNFLLLGLFSAPKHNPYAENTPLYLGNPSNAAADFSQDSNYLLEKNGYSLSYNNYTLGPNWVAWHLEISDLGDADRSNKFAADKEIPSWWYAVKQNDYQYNSYGFDRGHVCPSADRTSSKEANQETFLMTNMLPQAPDCNRIVWKDLESHERNLVLQGNELYIFAGGVGRGGTGVRGYFEEIPVVNNNTVDYMDSEGTASGILIPEFCWKIILVLPAGEDDINRITKETQVISVCIPNAQGCGANGSWEQYECSVDYIEEITGYDFFDLLNDKIEDAIER